MFVSSFNTYINTVNTDKTKKQDVKKSNVNSDFNSKLHQKKQVLLPKNDFKSPINYISNYKPFANKQKLAQDSTFTKDIDRYTKINKLNNAKTSYETNTKMFSLLRVPHVTLAQVKKTEENLPIKLQQKMVNTYISNDNYYKITA